MQNKTIDTRTKRKIGIRRKSEEFTFVLLLREEGFLVTFLDKLFAQLEVITSEVYQQ